MTPKRAIIWAAVSTRPQAEEDKFSITKQIQDAEAICRDKGWQIVDRLIVPGHSRNYRDLHTMAEHARGVGITAFDQLLAHFEARDFDVIICRDANRFARRASLLHYIVETIIEDCRANIYSLQDHMWVDENNCDMWATMKGYTSRAEMKWLVKAAKAGLQKRAERGLTTTKIPFSHKLVYDETHKPISVIIDESKRRIFDAVFDLVVVQRVPWNAIEKRLLSDYGYHRGDGREYGGTVIFRMLHHPLTWGGTLSGHYRLRKNSYCRDFGPWTFDPSVPPPDYVFVKWGTVTPIYTGEQAERLRAELWRRMQVRGRKPKAETHMFSGLIMCADCGFALAASGNRSRVTGVLKITSMRCNATRISSRPRELCPNKRSMKVSYMIDYVDHALRLMIAADDIDAILNIPTQPVLNTAFLEKDLKELEQQLAALIRLQVQAHYTAQSAYQSQIDAVGQQIEMLKGQLQTQRVRDARAQQQQETSRQALYAIRDILDDFWSLPHGVINQHLHRLMGNRRFVSREGKIIGVCYAKKSRGSWIMA